MANNNYSTKKVFGKAFFQVAGVSFGNRQNYLWSLRKAESAYLTLKREPKNANDPNAIQVIAHCVSKAGKPYVMCIGYVPKDKAIWLAKAMDAGKLCRIYDFEVVGGKDQTLGVSVKLTHELYQKKC